MGGIGARRAMLTAGVAAGPFTVGETNLTASFGLGAQGRVLASPTSPAPRTGTITSVSINASGSGTVYLVTGSLNTGTGAFVITAITGSLSAAGGAQTFSSLTLAINSGDRIAVWTPAAGGANLASSGAAAHSWYSNVITVPSAGASMTLTDAGASQAACLQGTGT